MSLTFPPGPLSGKAPETVNYRIDGPAHQLFMQEFPRRVRATFGGQAVFDTTRAVLLHETGYLPQVYVPLADIAAAGYPLTPGRYVGAAAAEDDGEPVDQKIARLTKDLLTAMDESARLETVVRRHVERLS